MDDKFANREELDPQKRSVLTRKYKLDDGEDGYVEQSTLLEPNNFVPLWENGKEELKEVSSTLSKIRKMYDQAHKLVMKREKQEATLRKQYEDVCEEEINALNEKLQMDEELEFAKQTLEQTKRKHEIKMMEQ